jgi:hypothetical protein
MTHTSGGQLHIVADPEVVLLSQAQQSYSAEATTQEYCPTAPSVPYQGHPPSVPVPKPTCLPRYPDTRVEGLVASHWVSNAVELIGRRTRFTKI